MENMCPPIDKHTHMYTYKYTHVAEKNDNITHAEKYSCHLYTYHKYAQTYIHMHIIIYMGMQVNTQANIPANVPYIHNDVIYIINKMRFKMLLVY